MPDAAISRMPTGISSLDPVFDGGVPAGSMILLLGDAGAGSYEFVYSSLSNILKQKREGTAAPPIVFPEEINYITFTRLQDDVRKEIAQSFNPDFTGDIASQVRFSDLSESYFDLSVVPHNWYSSTDIVTRLHQRSGHEHLLAQLSKILDAAQPGSLFVFDSITDIATRCSAADHWQTMAGFLRGLQRASKRWGSTSYLLLTRGILDTAKENEISDIADAVMHFRWEETKGERRQRVMYFDKFRGMMTHFEEKDIVRFKVRISSDRGFDVESIRVVI